MKYKLSEIGKVVGGGTPSTKHPEYYTGSGIPWLTPKDLSGYDKMYISKGGRDITQEGLENSSAKLLPANSVLVSSRAPIGYVAIAENEIATNQGFKSIIPNRELVIPEYLYFVMKTSKQDLEQIASGSTFKEVSTKVMSNFEVEIPDLDEQRKVLDYLLPITRKIEKNSRINDNFFVFSIFFSSFLFFDF
ncbi:restriction endonuclease subunit S [Ligilactobacillus agilis]|nr:restriction endonuclease subunit S [Ligilactobacillus agilis]